MKKMQFTKLLILIMLLTVLFPAGQVQGEVHRFSSMYLEITVPDDTILLTEDLPDTDEAWEKAGIKDPKEEKETFDEMGVQAILYDPDTKATVRLLQKQSEKSKEIFHLSLLSEEELNEFFDSLINTNDENARLTINEYSQKETTFFRLSIETLLDSTPISEIIYGTIVNGNTITFDVYENGTIESLNESYIKELVDGTHFTEYLDKTEVKKQEMMFTILSILFIALIIGILFLWIHLRKKKLRKQQNLNQLKADRLSKFYKEQEDKEKQNVRDAVLFINRTKYTEEIVKNFYIFDRIIKKTKFWITSAIVYLLLLVLLFLSSASLIMLLVTIVTPIVWVVLQVLQTDKTIQNIMKNYKNAKNKEATFTFYEDYFTMSGIQGLSKYPYPLITEISENKDYFYLYMGSDRAIYLKKDGFEEGIDDFRKFIHSK